MQVLSETEPVARKMYNCDASYVLIDLQNDGIFTPEEQSLIDAVKKQGWKILPGQKYRKCVCVDAGRISTYRALLEMDALLSKYDLYNNDDW